MSQKQTVKNIENADQIREEQKKRIEETHNKIKESTEYYKKKCCKAGKPCREGKYGTTV